MKVNNLCVKNLYFASHNGDILLKNISINLQGGDIICLLGQNGAGKSTLLKHCAGILEPSLGLVQWEGVELKKYSALELSKQVAWLPQNLSRAENNNVIDFITLGKMQENEQVKIFAQNQVSIDYSHILREFELIDFVNKDLSHLSGGEWKRTQLAHIFFRRPKLLLLDEPDGELDFKYKLKLIGICKKFVKQENAVLFLSTHDLDFARSLATKIIALSSGMLVWDSDSDLFWNTNIIYSLYGLKLSKNAKILYTTLNKY